MKRLTALQLMAAGLSVAAVSGAAVAQDQGDDFKRPLRSKGAQAPKTTEQSSKSVMTMRQDDGQNTVELRVEDGKYSAKLNGKDVPKDRIVREDDGVRVLDKDGKTAATFQISGDGGRTMVFGQPPKAPKAPKAPRAGGEGGAWTPLQMQPALPANPPKVMLGIIMDSPPEELLKNYSIKDGEAILITRVMDGLPADKAGLRENDLITEIDGKKPIDQDLLREVLRTKEPGDTIEFTVLRKGGDKSIRVSLGKYDPEKLGSTTWNMDPHEGGSDAYRKAAEEAMRQALKDGRQWQTFTMPGDGAQGFIMGGRGPDMDKKLAELDEKMSDLDKKLQRVDEQMNKLQAMIEKLSEQRGRR